MPRIGASRRMARPRSAEGAIAAIGARSCAKMYSGVQCACRDARAPSGKVSHTPQLQCAHDRPRPRARSWPPRIASTASPYIFRRKEHPAWRRRPQDTCTTVRQAGPHPARAPRQRHTLRECSATAGRPTQHLRASAADDYCLCMRKDGRNLRGAGVSGSARSGCETPDGHAANLKAVRALDVDEVGIWRLHEAL